MVVEVAQPVRHRYRIAAEFLVAIMMPLLLLLLAGWGIVWRVVNQQLGPLTHLADSLNRQTTRRWSRSTRPTCRSKSGRSRAR
jgi:hypothetical protein